MKSALRQFFLVPVLLAMMSQSSQASGIIGTVGVSGLGSFTGTFDYVATNATSATLSVTLNNTTPALTGGSLTGFAFNNPGDLVTDVSLTSGNVNFGLIGGLLYQNGISASPYGNFDIGVSSGSTFDGDSTNGITAGGSEAFEFALTGNSLDTLTAESFFAALSDAPGNGGARAMVTRFRGFAQDGTDTVPGAASVDSPPGGDDDEPDIVIPPPPPPVPGGTLATPEPSSLTLAGIALSCLLTRVRRRKSTEPV